MPELDPGCTPAKSLSDIGIRSGLKEPRYLRCTNLNYARFVGADISGSDFTAALLYRAQFTDMKVADEVKFEEAYLSDTKFDNSAFVRTSFRNALIGGASFKGARFVLVQFDGADLQKVDFSGAAVGEEMFMNAKVCRVTMPDGKIWNRDCPDYDKDS